MNTFSHGGNIHLLAQKYERNPEDLLDLSVNIRPEGLPEAISAALWQAMAHLSPYPTPTAEEAVHAAAKKLGIAPACIVFGNGSTELIHALPRAFEARQAVIAEPAFSEYRHACQRTGIPVAEVPSPRATGFLPDLGAIKAESPAGALVFIANPGNPAGSLLAKDRLLTAIDARPDLIWIIDEAFADYADDANSLLPFAATRRHLIVLRSLTKFYGMAGVRCGYAVAGEKTADRLRAALPPWSTGTPAIAAARAVFSGELDAEREAWRGQNKMRRTHLEEKLRSVPGVAVIPSAANYILFQWEDAPLDFLPRLIREYGIVVRDCANYRGLPGGGWYRSAVRFPEDHDRLAQAMQALARPGRPARSQVRHTPALMIQGTSSDAGKSLLAAAFCRIFRQDGIRVAPFKAQNMALHSGVTADGGEMGRAQITQAQACGLKPDVRMNPVLLKPHSDTGSQVIVMGHPRADMEARAYMTTRARLWPEVMGAYNSLAVEYDLMVLEGAGSPGEINLKDADLVNMNMARHARAAVLLAGDIDRGGVYASFLGTWMTFTAEERALLAGFIVNKFRGDASLLAPAHHYMLAHTGVPVLGTVPMIRGLSLPEEDKAEAPFLPGHARPAPGQLDVAIVMLAHVSNATDFLPLAKEPDLCVRSVRSLQEWGEPDLVIIPGSKSVVHDLELLRAAGLDEAVTAHARSGKWVLGICGGLQMMGTHIFDPAGVESTREDCDGLGLLDLRTTFGNSKFLLAAEGVSSPLGPCSGYEIHHGASEHGDGCTAAFFRKDGTPCGYSSHRAWATYLHGLFDEDGLRRAFIDMVRTDAGLTPAGRPLYRYNPDEDLDKLAAIVRQSTDMSAVYRALGI